MKLLIFGGTSEARRLSQMLNEEGNEIILIVATEYGKNILQIDDSITILAGRMDEMDMIKFIKDKNPDYVIDATHPYAQVVTDNIIKACGKTSAKRIRLVRDWSEYEEGVIYVDTYSQAVEFLNNTTGNIFITTGSNNLDYFTNIKEFQDRVFVRVLPMLKSLEKAIELGYRNSNIICMQGPFSNEINTAMIRATKSKFLITKDSGEAGGMKEKITSAIEQNCQVIVIDRPKEEGLSFEEVIKKLGDI